MSTSVGYIGGASLQPTYEDVCRQSDADGHTEAIRVVFDPSVLSFEELCSRFFAEATPNIWKTQYRSAIWTQTAAQASAAPRIAMEHGKTSVAVLAASPWHEAEAWHQKYYEKQGAPRMCRRLL